METNMYDPAVDPQQQSDPVAVPKIDSTKDGSSSADQADSEDAASSSADQPGTKASDQKFFKDFGIDFAEDADSSSYTVMTFSDEYSEQILYEVQVTNALLGVSIALEIFFMALFFFVFFIKVIKNNVTNLFT